MASLFDKENIINGIEGQLYHINLYNYLHSEKFSMPLKSFSDISKLQSIVKKDIALRLTKITADIDANWLASIMGPMLITTTKKLPVESLKYLEDDLILALTNRCLNALVPSVHYNILPYDISMNRLIILYYFISYNLDRIILRFDT